MPARRSEPGDGVRVAPRGGSAEHQVGDQHGSERQHQDHRSGCVDDRRDAEPQRREDVEGQGWCPGARDEERRMRLLPRNGSRRRPRARSCSARDPSRRGRDRDRRLAARRRLSLAAARISRAPVCGLALRSGCHGVGAQAVVHHRVGRRRASRCSVRDPYPYAGNRVVATLVETGVAELLAAELWRRAV